MLLRHHVCSHSSEGCYGFLEASGCSDKLLNQCLHFFSASTFPTECVVRTPFDAMILARLHGAARAAAVLRRMDTGVAPQSAGLFRQHIIQLECLDGGTSACRQTNDFCAIVTPPEMPCPLL